MAASQIADAAMILRSKGVYLLLFIQDVEYFLTADSAGDEIEH